MEAAVGLAVAEAEMGLGLSVGSKAGEDPVGHVGAVGMVEQ